MFFTFNKEMILLYSLSLHMIVNGQVNSKVGQGKSSIQSMVTCHEQNLPPISKRSQSSASYGHPCNSTEPIDMFKFKCRVKCGRGFKPTIKRIKCLNGQLKRNPNGKKFNVTVTS